MRVRCIGISARSALFEAPNGRKIELGLPFFKSSPEVGKTYDIGLAPFSKRWAPVIVYGIIALASLALAFFMRR
jgi:hypothetical protein